MLSTARAEGRSIWVDLLLYPTHTLPTAAAPVVVGVGLAAHDGAFKALPVVLAFIASWCIHVAGVFTDNHRLLAEHPEVPEHPELLRALADGSLSLRGLAWAIVGCLLLAALAGSYVVDVAGAVALSLGIVGVVASLSYALGPFSLTKLGIADVVFFLMFGVVAVAGTYYVQALHVRPEAFVIGLPIGAIVTNVLLIDDIRDRAFDARKGWHTPPLRYGLRGVRIEFAALMTLAYVLPLWFCFILGYGWGVLLPLLTLPTAFAVTRTVCTRDAFADLFPLTPKTSMLAFVYALLLGAGLAVSG